MDYSRLISYLEEISCPYLLDEPMKAHTSFQIGGPADVFVMPGSKTSLSAVLHKVHELELPFFILGNGTNLLVSDAGLRRVVIQVGGGLSELRLSGAREIVCGAGVKLSRLCNFALEHSLSGLESLWGIPGFAGGAAYMNAGAYGGEMKDVLVSCSHLTAAGEDGSLAGDELKLGYRSSAYMENNFVITDLTLWLSPGDTAEIRAKMDEFMRRRKEKQPLELPSAGSVFKRPKNNFAGTLIEECGLKGRTVGGAQVSEKHAGFIVNLGGATCSDVRQLMEEVAEQVFLYSGIRLEPEIKYVG